ncbi:MAG: hypothetical protein H0X02_05250 [Nitrosomonas sp.]|nr:hypothetical protein [Nitrosomonas sp.]
MIHQPEYMMTIFLQLHKLDSLQWPIAIVDYPARGQAPEIFAMRIKHPAASSGVLTTLFNLLVFNQLSPQGAGN